MDLTIDRIQIGEYALKHGGYDLYRLKVLSEFLECPFVVIEGRFAPPEMIVEVTTGNKNQPVLLVVTIEIPKMATKKRIPGADGLAEDLKRASVLYVRDWLKDKHWHTNHAVG